MVQDTAWVLSAAIVAGFAAVFIAVALGARRNVPYEAVLPKAGAIRRRWFWALVVLGVVVAGGTLPLMPYPRAQAKPTDAQVVTVIGKQWGWNLSAAEVKAGAPVEFRVTSSDVNHGFAIYDSKLRVVAQTQAMPGYINRLRHIFAAPGTYKIMCLEYCGLIHHDMTATIVVKP